MLKQHAAWWLPAMAIALMAASNRLAAVEWEAYTGIDGVGSVIKDSPATTDSLHYSGHGTAETATFHIELNGAHDIDRCRLDSQSPWVYPDYVIGNNQVTWSCGNQGTITATGTYTPPNTPRNGITITATVNDNNTGCTQDNDVLRQYANTLNAYRVGILVMPANVTIWEDQGGANPVVWTSHTDVNALGAYRITDYSDSWSSGLYENTGGWHLAAVSWKAVTEPANCDMIGLIQSTPRIDVAGTLRMRVWGDCPGGGAATITASAVAAAGATGGNPYVAAGAAVAALFVSGECCSNMAIAGDSAIEFVSSARLPDDHKVVQWTSWPLTEFGWPIKETRPLSGLSTSNSIQLDTNAVIRGSCKIESKVAILDNSWIQKAGGWIEADPQDTYYIKYGVSLPNYVP